MALPPLYDPDGDDDSRTPVVEKRTTILSTKAGTLVLVGGERRKAAAPCGAVATTAECRRRRKADRIMLPLDLVRVALSSLRCGWRISRDTFKSLAVLFRYHPLLCSHVFFQLILHKNINHAKIMHATFLWKVILYIL